MVAIKSHQAASFMKSADTRFVALLFYGSDAGLVSERAATAARAYAALDDPAGEIIRMDDTDLDADPGRLTIELQTIAMFGGRKVIRAAAGRRINAAQVRPLLDLGTLAGILIVEAGNLKPDDAMRVAFERGQKAAAVACFPDERQDLETILHEVLDATGLTISPDAKDLLLSRLGIDRALSRNEIEKLALYGFGKTRIDASDVDAVIGDASELAIDKIAIAAASGQGALAIAGFSRSVASGENPQSVIVAVQRYFQRLHRVRAELDQGRPLEDTLRSLKPALYFKQKDAFAAQVRQWSSDRLLQALQTIASASKATRQTNALEEILIERLILNLAQLARRSFGKHIQG